MKWSEFKVRLKKDLIKFMYGRNGVDQLTIGILIISLVLSIFAVIFRQPSLKVLYYLGVLVCLYRILSRDLVKRRRENRMMMRYVEQFRSWLQIQKRIFQERKTHRHFKCPNCKQRLRVPKGKGQITITCSKCGTKFSKKS